MVVISRATWIMIFFLLEVSGGNRLVIGGCDTVGIIIHDHNSL